MWQLMHQGNPSWSKVAYAALIAQTDQYRIELAPDAAEAHTTYHGPFIAFLMLVHIKSHVMPGGKCGAAQTAPKAFLSQGH